jgi:tetratricopeptide (TPR) repeat protein
LGWFRHGLKTLALHQGRLTLWGQGLQTLAAPIPAMTRGLISIAIFLTLCWLWPAHGEQVDLASRNKAASQAMSEGRYDAAAVIYREMLQVMPDEPGLLMNLGMALAMGGHEAHAIAPLQRAAKLNPKLLPAHVFLGSSYLAVGRPADAVAPLERAVAAQPADVENRRMLAQAYSGTGRTLDAVAELRRITELAPTVPAAWYALGHAYNALTQEAMATFESESKDSAWRQLLLADALSADGRFTDAFALYRASLPQLPSMLSIHDSIARIYEQTGHADWAKIERSKGTLTAAACAKRKALCEFRAGRHRTVLVAALAASDPESRYWRVRAATELALAAFKRLDDLPDSPERREVRATLARSQRRYVDAIAELKAALKFNPGDAGLIDDLGTSYYSARQYEEAVATLGPLVKAKSEDARLLTVYGDSLLQLQRVDEAIAVLKQAVSRDPSAAMARLTLGRAYVQKGEFAAAIPLIESQLSEDQDGSLHVQLARAYSGLGQREKAEPLLQRSQEIQKAAQERADQVAQRTITPPK